MTRAGAKRRGPKGPSEPNGSNEAKETNKPKRQCRWLFSSSTWRRCGNSRLTKSRWFCEMHGNRKFLITTLGTWGLWVFGMVTAIVGLRADLDRKMAVAQEKLGVMQSRLGASQDEVRESQSEMTRAQTQMGRLQEEIMGVTRKSLDLSEELTRVTKERNLLEDDKYRLLQILPILGDYDGPDKITMSVFKRYGDILRQSCDGVVQEELSRLTDAVTASQSRVECEQWVEDLREIAERINPAVPEDTTGNIVAYVKQLAVDIENARQHKVDDLALFQIFIDEGIAFASYWEMKAKLDRDLDLLIAPRPMDRKRHLGNALGNLVLMEAAMDDGVRDAVMVELEEMRCELEVLRATIRRQMR